MKLMTVTKAIGLAFIVGRTILQGLKCAGKGRMKKKLFVSKIRGVYPAVKLAYI